MAKISSLNSTVVGVVLRLLNLIPPSSLFWKWNPVITTTQKLLQCASPYDNLVIIFDRSSQEIASAFHSADNKASLFNLDDYERPLKHLSEEIHSAVMDADLMIMLVKKVSNHDTDEHITFRKPVIDLKYENTKLRVGSLLNPNPSIFPEIFAYNPDNIKKLNAQIYDLILNAHNIKITTPIGTSLQMDISHKYQWINQDADLTKPSPQHSLLAGEVYGYPVNVQGTAVIDGVLGGKFEKYGVLTTSPLHLEIENSCIQKVRCENGELEQNFREHIQRYENAGRVGELGFGTNTSLNKFYGIIGIDEKYPGNHIAFGHPYSEKTGAEWKSPVHIDGVMCKCTTWIGNTQVLADGNYMF